jgi:succinate-semialdehyde dehydrogenase/glutarate-semialdehyde dehydrogenase
VDAYSKYAASAMGAIATGENIFSAFLPLVTMNMHMTLGFQWASTLLALIPLVLFLAPSLVFISETENSCKEPLHEGSDVGRQS